MSYTQETPPLVTGFEGADDGLHHQHYADDADDGTKRHMFGVPALGKIVQGITAKNHSGHGRLL